MKNILIKTASHFVSPADYLLFFRFFLKEKLVALCFLGFFFKHRSSKNRLKIM